MDITAKIAIIAVNLSDAPLVADSIDNPRITVRTGSFRSITFKEYNFGFQSKVISLADSARGYGSRRWLY